MLTNYVSRKITPSCTAAGRGFTASSLRNGQQPTQRYMAVVFGLNGRMEKRLPIATVVHLTRVQDDPGDAAELTYTENVSVHGVCVVSRRAWRPGELAQVTSFKERIALRGKVVHCRKCGAGRYALGLALRGEVTWSTFRSYATG